MKLKEILEKKNKKAKELAIEIGTDEPMISKFVNYKCLPIPAQMKGICKSLDCKVSDVYTDEEIYYQSKAKKQAREPKELDFYNLCVRLPNEARKYLTTENLELVGYKNNSKWILACYKELVLKIKKARSQKQNENEPTKKLIAPTMINKKIKKVNKEN